MSKPVISVENLGKAYYLGRKVDRNATMRDALVGVAKGAVDRVRQRFTDVSKSDEAFWAVRHATFDVNRGEVLGLVGRNGAGKSTMLKMLSRIAEPSEGRAIIRGRVASLLEVGTGFHPELTGRENIYLNGAILGMKRAEISRKFDEIVAFSEVEKFLDTPVKRYSSGMYVRLAFAVAAHLDPEVLIVDEVLAVGDSAFQKKCLGKMGDVMRQGRTVLFVSHNMDAVANLCTHVVLCKSGSASDRMTPDEGIKQYLALTGEHMELPLREKPRHQHKERPPVFTGLKITTDTNHERVAATGGRVTFEIEVSDCADVPSATVGIAITNSRGQRAAFFHTEYHGGFWIKGAKRATLTCNVPSLPLVPGQYHVELVMANDRNYIEKLEHADRLDVVPTNYLGTGKLPSQNQGLIVLKCDWEVDGAEYAARIEPREPGEDPSDQSGVGMNAELEHAR